MDWQPGTRRVAPAPIGNWYAEPLAVDGALAAPLRSLTTTRVAVRAAVRSLLVRRALNAAEVLALRGAGVGPLELSQAFTDLSRALPPAHRAGALGIMVAAVGRVARTAPDVDALGDEAGMMRALGAAIAHALADALFPPPPPAATDLSKPLRQATLELLTARRIEAATLDGIPLLERGLLAARLEARLPAMQAVVPPARGETLARIVRAAGQALRQQPPIDAEGLDAALAGA